MAGAYAKIESHEELCAERYRAIFEGIGDLKEDISGHKKLIGQVGWWLVTTLITIVIALVGFLGTQLWEASRQPAYPVAIEAGP